jgi:hypothetical protein
MANQLPIPEDFQHLIEKREVADQRSSQDRRRPESVVGETIECNEEPSAPSQTTGDGDPIICPPERRGGSERRSVDRRHGNGTE